MEERIEQLDPGTAKNLLDVLSSQVQQSFDQIVQLDARLTNANFLTNGGAAVAVLAFLGTKPTSVALIISLVLFSIGVILAVLEIRTMLRFFGEMGKDAMRRGDGFLSGELRVRDCLVPPGLVKFNRRINHWAGILAQVSFIGGVVLSAIGLVCNGN